MNKNLFGTRGQIIDNAAGGTSYALDNETALAQYAVTGTLNGTFYATDKEQFTRLVELANKCSPEFVAQTAVYARQNGFMKDAPVVLLATLPLRRQIPATMAFRAAYPRVCDSIKQLRNLVQMYRSGALGVRSLPHCVLATAKRHLGSMDPESFWRQSIGGDLSTKDLLRIVHPAASREGDKYNHRSAMMAYLVGKPAADAFLPKPLRDFENYKEALKQHGTTDRELPDAPFEMLCGLPLSPDGWKAVARKATWNQTRQALNTFHRHGVFEDPALVDSVANKLRNKPSHVKSAPYEAFMTFLNLSPEIPRAINEAVQDVLEQSLRTIPNFGKVVVFQDTSGSMSSPIGRGKASCKDVAGLMTAAVMKSNMDSTGYRFDTEIEPWRFNPRDSFASIAKAMACTGGGTNCSLGLELLLNLKVKADTVIYVSDNESWVDRSYGSKTSLQELWNRYKAQVNSKAKMVLIDLTPNAYTPAKPGVDVLHVGGFSDTVWSVIGDFLAEGSKLTDRIREVKLT